MSNLHQRIKAASKVRQAMELLDEAGAICGDEDISESCRFRANDLHDLICDLQQDPEVSE